MSQGEGGGWDGTFGNISSIDRMASAGVPCMYVVIDKMCCKTFYDTWAALNLYTYHITPYI